jgi:hypothetical protein
MKPSDIPIGVLRMCPFETGELPTLKGVVTVVNPTPYFVEVAVYIPSSSADAS